jgi:hypothetical protein
MNDGQMDEAGDDRFQAQLRQAIEQLYEDTRLRDALDDSQAQQLLAWGMRELGRAAESGPELEERAATLREVLARVNQFVGGYAQWGEEQRREQMARLVGWLCHARDGELQIRDILQLEALSAAGETLSPQELFTALLAVVTRQEEEE